MHVQVILAQVSLDQQLILLRVSPRQHEMILTGHEPIKLFKPVRLAQSLCCVDSLHLHRQDRKLSLV